MSIIEQIEQTGFSAESHDDSLYIYHDGSLGDFEVDHFPIEGYQFEEREFCGSPWGQYRDIYHAVA